ncbi:thiol:disulfide interchange protein DsbG [Halomonas ramblicola]|uniref:thiol:disulfide interchange protein DsbG n=1 Tax=Halomonas ramblicola TaxID=747349 RepID=UPI0025B2F003|nr:thiol:disulfide interchange protein DsbG [Halomonas ramblicola]MDN3519965.1 thiol:disulfide interchange protein DsbG [Halomonas ramblicola]
MRNRRTPLLASLLMLSPVALADDHWPAPVKALSEQGLTIHGEFEAPGGLTGYGASHSGGEVAIYLLPDGEHAIVGTLVDAAGEDLSAAALDEHVRAERFAEVWRELEDSHWIADGDPDAERILYTFTDPNCPYCRRFWQDTRPWVEAGEVQLRHIMVGILESDSPAKAASLLGAEDPAAALRAHSGPGEEIEAGPQPREIEERVYANNQLFDSLGFVATPTTLYRDGDRVERLQGVPEPEALKEAMGGPAP